MIIYLSIYYFYFNLIYLITKMIILNDIVNTKTH